MSDEDEFQNLWAAVPLHEGIGQDKPKNLGENGHEPWCVIELSEDDPPIAVCDYPQQAIKVAEALNLLEFTNWLMRPEEENDDVET